MHFSQEVYLWLLSIHVIPNTAEQDEKGIVTLPPNIAAPFENGFAIADIIRKVAVSNGREAPPSLANIKADASRSAKLTNWNFIWIALESIDLKMDTRIKELILQGEQALIVELVRQLFERDEHKPENNKSNIRIKQSIKNSKQTVDMKKLDLSKNPEDSQTALEFLMLLLKTSLGMSVQEILGLFTNQNKYLAQIIVKGANDSFDPIVLFYTLLIKHSKKLKYFYEQDAKDAQACLNAVKPGLFSKSDKVVVLALDLFEKLGNIYSWFTGEGTFSTTFFLGVKRHPSLKKRFWKLLLEIIKKEQIPFFTKHYHKSFQSAVQQIEISTILIEILADSELSEQLVNLGIISGWIEVAESLREDDIEAQIIAFRFIGELMVFMPDFVQQNEDAMAVFQRQWFLRTLPEFATLLNQLVRILERLGEGHSVLASKIYQFLTNITKSVGPGDKRDYLVENFTPLVSKFTTIPTEYLIQHFKRIPLSHAEFLLVCESIEINKSPQTLISVGLHLKGLFLQNPLLNFYLSPLLKEIIQKVVKYEQQGHGFIMKMMDQAIALHTSLQIKYKSRAKHEVISFGKRDSSEKGSKQEQTELRIKQKWKQIVLGLIMSVLNVVMAHQEDDALKQSFRLKLLNSNNNIKASSFKVGCKAIQDALSKRFNITRQQLHQSFEQHSKKAAEMSDSMVRSLKPISHVAVASRIKGPQNLTKQFQQVSEKRKQEEEQRKVQDLKKKAIQQKKRLSVKKQLQITNLLRGQIGEAQLREEGFLERLIQEPKELEVIPPSEIEQRQLQAIDITFKKYHKVLRHLFLTYTFTSYNGHSNEKFEDNQQRKEILTVVELVRLLKDYKLAFLTSQSQISGIVRDINIKLVGRREVVELDYSGFQQFIVQFCALVMTRNHTITTTSSQGASISSNHFKNQPLHIIVAQFFNYLKGVFITRGEKTVLFDDAGQSGISKDQAADVEDYTKKVEDRPDYILPKGFKKVSENTIKFNYIISNNVSSFPEAYSTVIEIIDEILSQKPFNFHVIENISEKKTIIRVKPTTLVLQKERAMSTYIDKPIQDKASAKRRSTSKGMVIGPPKIQRNFKEQVVAALKGVTDAVQGGNAEVTAKIQVNIGGKQQAKQKRLQSMMKLQQLQKSKQQGAAKRAQQKEQQLKAQAEKQKEAETKRRQQTQRFLQAQKLKIAEKRRKQEQEQQRKAQEEEEKEAAKRENKERFKVFHQGQVGKIKKIEETALEKIRKERIQLEESKEQREQQRRRLKSQIEEEDKRIIQLRKETQKKIQTLYQSEPIRKVFAKYQPNLRGIFDFLLTNTYVSLTEKKHNNQIVFETWRQFVSSFELTAFVLPKDTTLIFKSLTKGKLASKDYFVGLTFAEFQQALLRLCIKYRNIFNLVSEKIKDDVNPGAKLAQGANQSVKQKEKQQNQFEAINEGTIKDILKENASKDSVQEWGEVSQVTDKTLLGMIYYLKVPRSKQGQEKRFRQIIARPHPAFAHQADWLKEKLNEQYTLLEPPKKVNNSKVMRENGEESQVSIK